jgi:hypothetical protein
MDLSPPWDRAKPLSISAMKALVPATLRLPSAANPWERHGMSSVPCLADRKTKGIVTVRMPQAIGHLLPFIVLPLLRKMPDAEDSLPTG